MKLQAVVDRMFLLIENRAPLVETCFQMQPSHTIFVVLKGSNISEKRSDSNQTSRKTNISSSIEKQGLCPNYPGPENQPASVRST